MQVSAGANSSFSPPLSSSVSCMAPVILVKYVEMASLPKALEDCTKHVRVCAYATSLCRYCTSCILGAILKTNQSRVRTDHMRVTLYATDTHIRACVVW